MTRKTSLFAMKDTKKGEICQFRICHTIFRYICAASVHFSKNTIGGLKQQETSENDFLMVWEIHRPVLLVYNILDTEEGFSSQSF